MARRISRSSRPQEPQGAPDAAVVGTPTPAVSAPESAVEPPVAGAVAGAEAGAWLAPGSEPATTAEGAVEGLVEGLVEGAVAGGGGAVGAAGAAGAVGGPMELKWILESLLFAAQKALTPRELRDYLVQASQDGESPEAAVFRKTRESDIVAALNVLQGEHEVAARSYRLLCVAGAWQFGSVPEYAPWLRALLGRRARPARLTQPGIETLTIVAYRQPVTRTEIEQIRGVSVDGVMQTLLERGLVEAVGRAEVVGRPVTYGTTPLFLEYFGLRSLEDLPSAEELRRLPVQKPEALVTVDPGLTTAPAEAPPPVVDLAEAEAPAGGGGTGESPAVEDPAGGV